jgi:hypothetical protein
MHPDAAPTLEAFAANLTAYPPSIQRRALRLARQLTPRQLAEIDGLLLELDTHLIDAMVDECDRAHGWLTYA